MSLDFAEQRVKMVDGQLRTTDVTNVPILDAMLTVQREAFVPARMRQLSYIDEDLPVSGEAGGLVRYIMEPSPFGRLLQLAEIRRGDFVLDIGCASGYSSAIISRIADAVVALESEESLVEDATSTLQRLGFDNVAVVKGELAEGYPSQAPYDVIVIEGAVDEVPPALFDQLREGGRLVAIVGQGPSAFATLYMKEAGLVSHRRAFNASVPSLPEFRRAPAFQF
jgi:protein-L-isoaspartate(D-aspartate) O-methyltransferase